MNATAKMRELDFEALEAKTLLAADAFLFDPDGADGTAGQNLEAIEIAGFDWAPGAAVAEGVNANDVQVGDTVRVRSQSALGNFIGPDGQALNVPGLNSEFEVTLVQDFVAEVTAVGPDGRIDFELAEDQGDSFGYEIRWDDLTNDTNLQANPLTGEGFKDCYVILAGAPTEFDGSLRMTDPGEGNRPLLDSFGQDDFNGTESLVVLTGGSTMTAGVEHVRDEWFTDTAITPAATIVSSSTIATPFNQTNPSQAFFTNKAGEFTPDVGEVNGLGNDVMFQSDSATSMDLHIAGDPDPGDPGELCAALDAALAQMQDLRAQIVAQAEQIRLLGEQLDALITQTRDTIATHVGEQAAGPQEAVVAGLGEVEDGLGLTAQGFGESQQPIADSQPPTAGPARGRFGLPPIAEADVDRFFDTFFDGEREQAQERPSFFRRLRLPFAS